MKDYRLLEEDDESFHVDDGSGKPFRVPKDRLMHRSVERIRKHFADGGQVPRDSDIAVQTKGDQVKIPPRSAPPKDDPAAMRRVLMGVQRQPMADGGPVLTEEEKQALADLGVQPPTAPPGAQPAMTDDVRALRADPTAPAPGPAAGPPTTPVALPSRQAELEQTRVPSQVAGPPADTTAQTLQSAATAESAALGQEGAVKKAGFDVIAQKEQAEAVRRQAMADEGTRRIAVLQGQHDRLYSDIVGGKIDPNRYWKDAGGQVRTGQVITSSIAMILGGIGAGLTKGPNYAMEMINKGIEHDIDAQKEDRRSKLSIYLNQTHDLDMAKSLLRADMSTATAGQIAAETSKMNSSTAMPAAQVAIQQLRAQAATNVQGAVTRGLQQQEMRMNLAVSQQHAQALGQLMKGLSGGGGFDRRILEMPGFEKQRERAVDLPDGSFALADDKGQADKARESYASVSRFKAKLARYMDLLNSGSPETIDRGTAQEMHADVLAEMGHLHDLNRLTDVDLQLFKNQVPDISRWWSLKAVDRQKLRGLGKSVDDKVWSNNRSLLHLPDASRPGR